MLERENREKMFETLTENEELAEHLLEDGGFDGGGNEEGTGQRGVMPLKAD